MTLYVNSAHMFLRDYKPGYPKIPIEGFRRNQRADNFDFGCYTCRQGSPTNILHGPLTLSPSPNTNPRHKYTKLSWGSKPKTPYCNIRTLWYDNNITKQPQTNKIIRRSLSS